MPSPWFSNGRKIAVPSISKKSVAPVEGTALHLLAPLVLRSAGPQGPGPAHYSLETTPRLSSCCLLKLDDGSAGSRQRRWQQLCPTYITNTRKPPSDRMTTWLPPIVYRRSLRTGAAIVVATNLYHCPEYESVPSLRLAQS